ncbi:MAG: hypothetical protein LAO31_20650 [Acidobacteriia bacterium]|nr:hypothetical protein [Terriglobia bacterium]
MKTSKPIFISLWSAMFLMLFLSVPILGQTNLNNILRYAHVANGVQGTGSGSGTYVTTLLVSNPNNFLVHAVVDSFDDANPNNTLNIGFTTDCPLTTDTTTNTQTVFAIAPFSACRLLSAGTGQLKTGWLRIFETDSSGNTGTSVIGGYLTFTFYQGNQFTGFPIFTVGVSPVPIFNQFSLPIVRDAATNQDIGFAMANPFTNPPVVMTAQLFNSSGTAIDQHVFTMDQFSHVALFLSQLFPGTLGSVNNFVGNLVVFGDPTLGDGAVATALLQQGSQFGGASPNSDIILQAKSAGKPGRQEATGPMRPHEKINNIATGPVFF